jgi:hypothetical protein
MTLLSPGDNVPIQVGPYQNITPFTYRDGLTYLRVLESLREWLNDSLVPYVDAEITKLITETNTAITQLEALIETATGAANAAQAVIDQGKTDVAALVAQGKTDINALVDAADTNFNTILTNVTAIQTAITADKTAVDADVVTVQGFVTQVQALLDGSPSKTDWQAALDAIDAIGYATNDRFEYLPNASAIYGPVGPRQIIPTPDGGNQSTHPSVVFQPDTWNGYKYWMAYTPYTGTNDALEDPCLVVSQDGVNWVYAPGVSQPIDDAPGTPGGSYNSDPDIVITPEGVMYYFWRTYYVTGHPGAEEVTYFKTSTDGRTFSAKKVAYQFDQTKQRLLSPSFIFENGTWTVYAVNLVGTNTSTNVVRMVSTTADPSSTWSAPFTIDVGPMQDAAKHAWHIEVRKQNGKYIGLLNDTTFNPTGSNGDLLFLTSGDGITFQNTGATVIPRYQAGEHERLYRATLIPSFQNGVAGYTVWYSARNGNDWHIYRTHVAEVYPAAMSQIATGVATLPVAVAVGDGTSMPVVLPAGQFNIPPQVLLTSSTSRLTISANSITATGFTIRVDNYSDGTLTGGNVTWTAIANEATLTVGDQLRGQKGDQGIPGPAGNPADAVAATTSTSTLVIDGDSLEAQGGGLTPPTNIGAYLATYLPNNPVLVDAVGGEVMVGGAAREGGLPYLVSFTGGSIPASGGVVITLATITGVVQYPLLQPNGNPALGQTFVGSVNIANVGVVAGTITLTQPSGPNTTHQADDFYTFTRTVAGVSIPVTRPVPFYQDFAWTYRNATHIFHLGRNDIAKSIATQSVADCVTEVMTGIAAMIEFLGTAKKNYIILPPHNGTGLAAYTAGTATTEGVGSDQYLKAVAVENAMLAAYGRRVVNYRKYLINYGLADLGLTATTNDTADIAAQTVPRQLLVDGLHFQTITKPIIAGLIRDRLVELKMANLVAPVATAPGQVTGLAGVHGNGQVALSWVAPANNGATITDYFVQYKLSTDPTWLAFGHVASSVVSQTVTGLTNGSSYDFRVSAVNGIGTGVASSVVSVTPVVPFSILDNFDRADSTNLGALWQTQTGFQITSNLLTTQTTASTVVAALLTGPIPSPDHQISATINRGNSTSTGLMVRAVDTANFYGARINNTGNILIYKNIAGVTTSLSGSDGLWTSDGAVLTLKVVGTAISVLVNGIQVLTTAATDATLASATGAGVRAAGGTTKPTYDTLTVS